MLQQIFHSDSSQSTYSIICKSNNYNFIVSGDSKVPLPLAKEQEMVGVSKLEFRTFICASGEVQRRVTQASLLCGSTIQGTLPQSRHFLFIDDAVDAFLLVLEKGVVGEIYNVGSSFEIPIVQLARELVKMVSLKDAQNIVYYPSKKVQTRFICFIQVKNVPESEINDWLEFVPDR